MNSSPPRSNPREAYGSAKQRVHLYHQGHRNFRVPPISDAAGTAGCCGWKEVELGIILGSIWDELFGDVRGLLSKNMHGIGRMHCVSSGSIR